MKSLREVWTELQINAHELKGAIAWLSVLAAADLVILNWPGSDEIPPEVWKPWADSFRNNSNNHYKKPNKKAYSSWKPEYKDFTFNPMTVTADSLQLLGVKPWIAKRFIKYRESGGRFRSAIDFEKIYGIKEDDKQRLVNHARFTRNSPSFEKSRLPVPPEFNQRRNSTISTPKVISLNEADSSTWERLPDIGPVLASRIIKYRNKLGGFVRREQLLEVFGLDTSAYMLIAPRIEVSSSPNQFLDWTTADAEVLAKHPYVGKYLAAKIVRYREQNRHIPERMSINSWRFIDSVKLEKLKPYLSKP